MEFFSISFVVGKSWEKAEFDCRRQARQTRKTAGKNSHHLSTDVVNIDTVSILKW